MKRFDVTFEVNGTHEHETLAVEAETMELAMDEVFDLYPTAVIHVVLEDAYEDD